MKRTVWYFLIVAILLTSCIDPGTDPGQLPTDHLELTYVSGADYNEVYRVDIGCLEADIPCVGDSTLLFQLDATIYDYNWSPDGQRIALSAILPGARRPDIFIADWDGSNLINLTNTPEIFDDRPFWSPNGERLAFNTCGYEGCRIVIRDLEVADPIRILLPEYISSPLLSGWADGKLLFQDDDENGTAQLYLLDLDSIEIIQLTNTTESNIAASLSPDGRAVVFVREIVIEQEPIDSSTTDLYILSLDTMDEARLTQDYDVQLFSVLSAYADIIVYESSIDDALIFNIYLLDLDSGEIVQVTDDLEDQSSPAWRYVSEPLAHQ